MTKTIALFRNGLGNFILYTPALQALASMDESGKIDVCIDSEWKDYRRQALIDMIKGCPFVESLIDFPNGIEDKKYNCFFWTRHTYPSAALEYFRTKEPRLDVGGMNWTTSGIHEIDYYMNLVRERFGYTGETPKQYAPKCEGSVLGEQKKTVITFCNGSYGHIAGSKKWPYFKELIETIKSYFNAATVKIGSNDELSDCKCDYGFVNNVSILQTANIIAQSNLLITTDTCNMHIGDALNVPMVVLWGGSILSKNRPVNGKNIVVQTKPGCAPCHEGSQYNSCSDYKCMNKISVGQVMQAARTILEK